MKTERDKSFHFWLTEELSDQFDRVERMLKWLVAFSVNEHIGEGFIYRDADGRRRRKEVGQPDISDILEEK